MKMNHQLQFNMAILFTYFTLLMPSTQLSGPTVDGSIRKTRVPSQIQRRKITLDSGLKYEWKTIVQIKLDFLMETSIYKKTLTNYGINFSKIYNYLSKEKWDKLVDNFDKFSNEIKSEVLIDIAKHLKVLPKYNEILHLRLSEDKKKEINKWKSLAKESNKRPFENYFLERRKKFFSNNPRSMRQVWEILKMRKNNRHRHEFKQESKLKVEKGEEMLRRKIEKYQKNLWN